mmetsp:Transcript_4902/g.13764  ORF Transcript_4902/g.13764 Transcript_4902/m.13764 type:complete len:922 (+) Transcript_4902:140-2905(+)
MRPYTEAVFRERVEVALKEVRKVLENNKNPVLPEDVQHTYSDKYLFAEYLTNTAIGAQLNVLEVLGLTSKDFSQLKEWAASRSVTLCLTAEERCKFDREETRKVESSTTHVREYSGFLGGKSKVTDKVITKVKEYFWKFDFEYELFVYAGSDPKKDRIRVQGRSGQYEIKTTSDSTPRPVSVVRSPISVNITWLLRHVTPEIRSCFAIDRQSRLCHTPRRNPDVIGALTYTMGLSFWAEQVHDYFVNTLFPVQTEHGLDLAAINSRTTFSPVLPFFEGAANGASSAPGGESGGSSGGDGKKEDLPTGQIVISESSAVIPLAYLNPFLSEQMRSLGEKHSALAKVFPEDGRIISVVEANLLVTVLHLNDVCHGYSFGVEYIEDMLRRQLISAIGKVVEPRDFAQYMNFHNRKLFRSEYRPSPFCFAVRRPEHYPEGVLSIEQDLCDGSVPQPIETICRRDSPGHPMRFALNAATNVVFHGDRYLHGFVMHQFSGGSPGPLSLVARARQFSCFVMMVGRIAGADLFEPSHAIVVQNKDDLKIPLMLEQIPTPKEFRDAIESLSPEQQRFAKAFRAMQLESTLFGVCIVQIKPQLEKLLKLPNDSLTKEIQLTQQLLTLFIEYQIPSDLISYSGPEDAPLAEKIATVRKYVDAMNAMIEESKSKEIKEAEMRQDYRMAENDGLLLADCGFDDFSAEKVKRKKKKMPRARMAERSAAPKPIAKARNKVAAAPPAKKPAVAEPGPKQPTTTGGDAMRSSVVPEDAIDYTKIPTELDAKYELLDVDGSIHPTIVNAGATWVKKYQKALLADPTSTNLAKAELTTERNKAFDLLDALSKSGALAVDEASLHIVICATHTFDKNLVDTIVQDNVNPIEKVERSSLIIASTIHEAEPVELIKENQVERVSTYSPNLFESAIEHETKDEVE